MFRKLLIANRGEIACRIVKTARRLGIRTAAVYSDADAASAHVALADEARHIGASAPRESYLNIEAIVGAARLVRADAVHPGYGFLSENPDFASACEAAGLTFIGPTPDAIRVMGSKSEAKRIMLDAQVPLVPGYHGEDQSPERLRAEADAVGYPVLIKASAGGGGRGMRVVTSSAEFDSALESAKREARGAFGDDRVLIERYVAEPRHVEIQIFGDQHGNMVHLFERDCSAQRRYQKIVEEAPAPGVGEELRARMCDTAIAAARAIGYVGAGTVELLLDRSGHFYFMEMNTRLQVEHPVTELITGEDLVEWQLLVAAGEPVPRHQEQIRIHGHAIEARLYAEDPANKFMPSTGRLTHLRFPDRDPLVRIDSGVRPGDEISFYYDPMIAKVIAWGDTRTRAAERLSDALRETEVVGVTTNAAFLARLVAHPEFVRGGIDTGFVAEHGHELLEPPALIDDAVVGTAALALLLERREGAGEPPPSEDRYSPWDVPNDWRLNEDGVSRLGFEAGGETYHVRARTTAAGYVLELPSGATAPADVERRAPGRLRVTIGPMRREIGVVRQGTGVALLMDGRRFDLTYLDPDVMASADEPVAGGLTAPMPGKVISVNVEPGQAIRRGTTVVVMEAMKMEHNIVSPTDGVVAEIRYRVGDLVDEGAELIVIDTG